MKVFEAYNSERSDILQRILTLKEIGKVTESNKPLV